MQATTLKSTNAQFVNYQKDSSAGLRALQNAFLSELPGMTFAVLTLIYVVSSLVRL
jgi:hypothetical protein